MAPASCTGLGARRRETFIFLDVDGVLNVNVRNRFGGPLLLSQKNLEGVRMQAKGCSRPTAREMIHKLISISERELGHGEAGTYAALATSSGSVQDGHLQVSPVLVERCAQLIRMAGPHRTVVLSSSWRSPRHQAHADRLQREISALLGEDFAFDARTPLREESTPQERLRCIGDFIHSLDAAPEGGRRRFLVLDDFFAMRLRDLALGGRAVDSVEDAERYLLDRSRASDQVSVKVVQPFEDWMTPKGLRVQIGAGLTMKHFSTAVRFLDSDAGCGCRSAGQGLCPCRDCSLGTADGAYKGTRKDSDSSTADEVPEEPAPPSQGSVAGTADEAPEQLALPVQVSGASAVDGSPKELAPPNQDLDSSTAGGAPEEARAQSAAPLEMPPRTPSPEITLPGEASVVRDKVVRDSAGKAQLDK